MACSECENIAHYYGWFVLENVENYECFKEAVSLENVEPRELVYSETEAEQREVKQESSEDLDVNMGNAQK